LRCFKFFDLCLKLRGAFPIHAAAALCVCFERLGAFGFEFLSLDPVGLVNLRLLSFPRPTLEFLLSFDAILFGASFLGNITQFLCGVKIENNQTQIVQTYSLNQNDNANYNIINSPMTLTNAQVVTYVSNGVTNFRVMFNYSTNVKDRIMQAWAVTNQTNTTKIGIIPK
jgi:hypothetical protein